MADGLVRRATAIFAAAAGSRTVDSRFIGVAASGRSGWLSLLLMRRRLLTEAVPVR